MFRSWRPFASSSLMALVLVSPASFVGWLRAAEPPTVQLAARFDPVERTLEGWKVHVDPALLEGESDEEGGNDEGQRALRMLADHLHRISLLVDATSLEKLRSCEIWIEKQHPSLESMQYHPALAWLTRNGHDPRLVKKVHIPRAAALLERAQLLKHPAVVLHELAHAYHDQHLGFDNADIEAAWHSAMERHLYDQVLQFDGRQVKHYATTNHREYFAESTEAYFYRNDFYPFVRGELLQHDPHMHALLEKIWGKLD